MQGLSMNSSATGITPAPMIASTAAPAISTLPKAASMARAPSGERRTRTVTSVTMPNCPSEPVISPSQS